MRIETAVITKLGSLATVAAAVGARIHADDIDDGDELPAIVVLVTSETPQDGEIDLDGQATLWEADVDIEVYARTRTEARDIEEKIRDNGTDPGTGLNGFGGATANGTIRLAVNTGSESSIEAPQNAEGSPRYVQTSTYFCQYDKPSHGH